MHHPRQTEDRSCSATEHPITQAVRSLRSTAAHWLMPADDNGYDGSVQPCRHTEFQRETSSTEYTPESHEKTDLVRAAGDESEVIWLTRLVAIVASGVLTMMVWLFTLLSW